MAQGESKHVANL